MISSKMFQQSVNELIWYKTLIIISKKYKKYIYSCKENLNCQDNFKIKVQGS